MRILVAYASQYGATAEIAQRIADVLGKQWFTADVRPVDEVTDLSPYDAVILGSAVYMGQWMRDAANFLHEHVDTLASLPVWLFSSGPTDDTTPPEITEGVLFPAKLRPTADQVKPRGIAVFHGSLEDDEGLTLMHRAMIRRVDIPVEDARDWDAITTWAKQIALDLNEDANTFK